jgi:hypothetical protein
VLLPLNQLAQKAVSPDADMDLETETEKDLAAGSAIVNMDAAVTENVASKTVAVTLAGQEALSQSEATLVCEIYGWRI